MKNKPVAWMQHHYETGKVTKFSPVKVWEDDIPLYLHPADLTDEEIDSVIHELRQKSFDPKRWVDVYTIAIETIIQLRDELAILKKASEK